MLRFFLAAALSFPSIALAQDIRYNYDIAQEIIAYAGTVGFTVKQPTSGSPGVGVNGGNINLISGTTIVPRARVIAVPHGDVMTIEITTPTEIWDFEVWNQACTGFKGEASFAYNEEVQVAALFFMDDTDGKESISLVDTAGDWLVQDLTGLCE